MVLLLPLLPSLALLLLLHSFPLSPSPIIFTSFVQFHIFKFIPLILSLAMSPAQSYVLHLIPILTSSLLNNSIHLFPSSLLNALLFSIISPLALTLCIQFLCSLPYPIIFTILFLINSIHHHLLLFSIHFYPFTLFIACPCFSVCPSCTATFINFLCLTLFLYLACGLACPLYSTHLAMVCPYTGLPLHWLAPYTLPGLLLILYLPCLNPTWHDPSPIQSAHNIMCTHEIQILNNC